jgi:hypothetical protein
MKNKDLEQILNGYNNRLIHFDAKRKILEQMIADLNVQLSEACKEWDFFWRERQIYINSNEKELEASK